MNNQKTIIVSIFIAVIVAIYLFSQRALPKFSQTQSGTTAKQYTVTIDPENFSPTIDNTYFRLPIGRKLVFEAKTASGQKEVVAITIPGETRQIMGVTTLVYRDTVTVDGEVVEDTKDYLAQDTEGNVWYFGEDVNNYADGILIDHEGSWIAGQDGALPGIWIKAQHIVGDSYLQEYYKGIAEDTRDVKAIGVPVRTALGNYQDCVQMYDYTPLDSSSQEYKYYCAEVGSLVASEHLTKNERVELVEAN